jgi:anti-sigma28 factor (negative regulator of flagellin synthesis)
MREQNQENTVRDIHRITAIRNRIAGRAYEVDARQIADKFINLEKALSGKK